MITYTALSTALNSNAAAVAAAAGGGAVTTANIQALADLLTVLAQSKDLGQPALIKSKQTTKNELNAT